MLAHRLSLEYVMGTWSIGHWVVVLIVVLLLFGTKRLRNIGSDLGAALKGFKQGMAEGNEPAKLEADPKPAESVTGSEKESVPKS
jgi:sec-independent protein translocase protein TatA